MQDSTFIGLDVHKATISVAVARGERGGEVRHWGTVPHRPDHVRKLVEKLAQAGGGCISATRQGPAAMACTASLSRWGMSASWWRPRSSR
jgi:transposase